MTTSKLWRWKDLAINANISEETIYALQAGRQKARDLTIYKIANALGVEPSEFVKEEQE